MANFAALEGRLRKMCGRLSETQVPKQDLYEVLGEAYSYILDRYLHKEGRAIFKIDLVAGTASYTLPADVAVVMKVWDVQSGAPLIKAAPSDVLAFRDYATGRAGQYYTIGDKLFISPAPDAVRELAVMVKFTVDEVVNPSESPRLNSSWDKGILLRARFEYYDGIGDMGKAQYALAAWNEWVSGKPTSIEDESVDSEFGTQLGRGRGHGGLQLRNGFNHNGWRHEEYPL